MLHKFQITKTAYMVSALFIISRCSDSSAIRICAVVRIKGAEFNDSLQGLMNFGIVKPGVVPPPCQNSKLEINKGKSWFAQV
jgi:hypothetical protein